MTILVGQCTRPDLILTIYDETKFSSCHSPYTNNILNPVSSNYFLSHKKLFQAGNFNVNVRPDLLYFSIWGVYSITYQKHNLWPVKTAKTLCTSSRRLVWWNVIHSTKMSVVLLALKAKGQKYWMPLVCSFYVLDLHRWSRSNETVVNEWKLELFFKATYLTH